MILLDLRVDNYILLCRNHLFLMEILSNRPSALKRIPLFPRPLLTDQVTFFSSHSIHCSLVKLLEMEFSTIPYVIGSDQILDAGGRVQLATPSFVKKN